MNRYYIERFLADHAADIQGRVLEVGTDMYTRRFGGDRVTTSDVLHVSESLPRVTIVGDLTDASDFAPESYDCVVLTATLQFIYDVRAALTTVHGILSPGGVLLATAPGISAISRYDMDRWGDYWRFTTRSLARLLEETLPHYEVRIDAHGNVLSSIAFLHGLAADELDSGELDHRDADYELLIAARARKPKSIL